MINIVMVARDRHKLTEQSLKSLRDHTDPKIYTITLVDDNSIRPLAFSPEQCGCTSIRISNSAHILGTLKNLGVYWSEHHFGRGEWLYLSDNDVYFMEHWAEQLTRALAVGKQHGYLLLGGQNHPYHHHDEEVPSLDPHWRTYLRTYQSLAGTSWLMPWSTWDKYGPLEETCEPGVCKGEDQEFCQKIRRDGFKVGAVWPHVVLDTGITQTGGTMSPGHEIKQRVPGVLYE